MATTKTEPRSIEQIQRERESIRYSQREEIAQLAQEQRLAIIAMGGYAANAREFKEAVLSGQEKEEPAAELVDTLTERFKHNYSRVIAYDFREGLPQTYARLGVSPESSKTEPTPLRFKVTSCAGYLTLVLSKTITFDYPINPDIVMRPAVVSEEPSEVYVAYFGHYMNCHLDYGISNTIVDSPKTILEQYIPHYGDTPHRDDAFFDQLRFARDNL